jgi:hypothetical protein
VTILNRDQPATKFVMDSTDENMDARVWPQTEDADRLVLGIEALYRPRFSMDGSTRMGSLGGEFAPHAVRYFDKRDITVLDEEPAPPGLRDVSAHRFGYRLHSARCGNIGSPRQLRQLLEECLGEFKPENAVWEKGGRYFDAMRPTVEPNGLSTPEVVADHRAYHLSMLNRVLGNSDVLLLVVDSTDGWEHVPSGTIFPTAPGIIAGSMDSSIYRFRSFTFQEIYDDLSRVFALAKSANANVRFVLGVSPERLSELSGAEQSSGTAAHSKSILRAAAWQLARERSDVDYMPVYEIGGVLAIAATLESDGSAKPAETEAPVTVAARPKPAPKLMEMDDDEELARMLAGDDLCEEILDETFKP